MPSDVRSSASGCGSCIKKPLARTAVITPGTPDDQRPGVAATGARRPGCRGSAGPATPAVVNEIATCRRSRRVAGVGSRTPAASVTCSRAARQVGGRVDACTVVGARRRPRRACGASVAGERERLGGRVTGSVNGTVTSLPGATSTAPSAGSADSRGWPRAGRAAARCADRAPPAVKSAALSSVSVAPSPPRLAAVVLEQRRRGARPRRRSPCRSRRGPIALIVGGTVAPCRPAARRSTQRDLAGRGAQSRSVPVASGRGQRPCRRRPTALLRRGRCPPGGDRAGQRRDLPRAARGRGVLDATSRRARRPPASGCRARRSRSCSVAPVLPPPP